MSEISENETPFSPPELENTEQSISMAVFAGLISSIVAAALWALITYATGYQIGLVAVGVGFVVGFAVNLLGKGNSITFGVIGGSFALFGCVLGNFLTAVIAASMQDQVPILEIVAAVVTTPSVVIEVLKETFSPMDLLFYGIAVYEAFKFSMKG